MTQSTKCGFLIALAGAGVLLALGTTRADAAATGGLASLDSPDGNLSAQVGGRLQFDGYVDHNDSGSTIGSGVPDADEASSFRFRRVWVTLTGKVYDFDYHLDYDFVSGALQRAWLSHGLLAHGTLYIGQDKPWASMDEIASNADTPFLERNIASASGVNSAATYAQGLFYDWQAHALSNSDSLWLGLSASSLHKQSGNTDTSTQGTAFNGRIAYAPIVEQHRWLHLGLSLINANADTGSTTAGANALLASYVYGNHFDGDEKLTLADYPVSSKGARPHANTLGAELAGAYGPLYVQAEYDDAAFHEAGEPDNTVTAYSVTAAYTLTGETRPYRVGDATYGAITPASSLGAWELALRYDHARNDGNNGVFTGLALAGAKATLATLDEVSMVTVGLNYYASARVRFMFDYERGTADLGRAGSDSPSTFAARAQIVF
ncbi:MAG: porin [Steroidobacteraceae bacterium]